MIIRRHSMCWTWRLLRQREEVTMEFQQRRALTTRNRNPLYDCTNSHASTSSQSSSSTPSVPLKPSKANLSTSYSVFNKITKSKSATTTNASNTNRTSLPPPPYRPDELSMEQEAERKIGWLVKILFLGTASVVAYQFFPYMGDNLMQQSVSLLQVKDPLFKRMGASRLARFAIDDERRKKIVEMGGAQELLNMLRIAKDDRTRKAALKALDALSNSDDALASLHHAGAIPIIQSTPNSLEDADVERFKLSLMRRFQDLRYDVP